jgi:hypothetical protein
MNNNTKTNAGYGKHPSAPSIMLENVSFGYPGEQSLKSDQSEFKEGVLSILYE